MPVAELIGVLRSFKGRSLRLAAPLAVVVASGCTGVLGGSPLDSTDPATDSAAECGATPALAKPRIWRLTRSQLANTLRDEFGIEPAALSNLPSEARLDGFANQASQLRIAPLLAEVYFALGEELGAHALQNPDKFGIACDAATLAPGSCLEGFIATTGRKLWRRPLSATEVADFSALFAKTAAQGAGPAGGVTSVVQALFMSPSSLHRTELGTVKDTGAVTPLADHEIASALSYMLWDSAPDAELAALADQGKLRDRTVLLDQAKRLFEARDKASPAMSHFFEQWLELENLPNAVKDADLFPMATPELNADLKEELRLFTDSVLFDAGADRRFDSLFTSTYAFVNERTAPLYGLSGVTGDAMVRRELNPAERRGILTSLPFLWGHAHAQDTALVGRGAYVRAEILCHRVPLPPGGVPNPGKFAEPNATGRQRLGIHASPACAVCHKLFDGIGFALESYDPIGRFRTTEHGQEIDASGSLPLPSEGNKEPGIVFSNFVELVDELAQKPDVYGCFAQQFAAYASGYDLPELDACEKERVVDDFARSQNAIDQLVLSVIASPSFIDRKN
ncbi:DUF1592 domain-containing protein [Sorangium sp. So ce296]|uniref:DUF1592 domain-containing protein n=1 Tax=Sorangium sp. So ce296 TaxID=3133296 RepID=UPI003F6183ED